MTHWEYIWAVFGRTGLIVLPFMILFVTALVIFYAILL